MTKTNSKLSRFLTTKSAKILACFLILVVLISSFAIYSFADDHVVYQTIAPINFNNYGGDVTAVAFPGPHTEQLYIKEAGVLVTEKTYLNNNDYYNEQNTHLLTKTIDGKEVTYIKINLICNYSSVYINGVVYYGSTASSPASMNLFNVYEFISYPVSNSFVAGTEYRYYFDVILTNADALEQSYQNGYDAGHREGYLEGSSSQAIQNARDEGYNAGVADGRTMTDSQNLGSNLLGDTLNAPMKALNDFVIYESTNGFEVTLGLVVGGAISLTLFIAFLKIFAGG